jgi:hypothetical protein
LNIGLTDSSSASWLEQEIQDAYHPERPDVNGAFEEKPSRTDVEFCQFCNTRIDEKGWCGCDTIGGD